MKQYRKKATPLSHVDFRVTGEEHRESYNQLMTLYRIAEYADGIKALVVHTFRYTGVWGVVCDTWAEFCEKILRLPQRSVHRMVSEGEVALKLLTGDPFLTSLTSQIKAFAPTKCYTVDPTGQFGQPVPQINTKQLTGSESALLDVASDRKMLRIIKQAPHAKWVEVATEATRNGKATTATCRAAAAMHVKPKAGPVAKPDTLPTELAERPLDRFRSAVTTAAEYFTSLARMQDRPLADAASSVHEYCRKVNQSAKGLR